MEAMNRFGNMFPPPEYMQRPYLMDRPPFRIMKNLYFVGNLWTSSHLIDTGDGLLLLDTPCALGLPGLMNNIGLLGYRLQDLKTILVSHAHTDHFGAVQALVHMTGAKTYIGRIDGEDMTDPPKYLREMTESMGSYNEFFTPDVMLEDGDVLEQGDVKIRCVLTPGHTRGVMSHFWEMRDDDGAVKKIGIYGGAGFLALSHGSLKKNEQPESLREDFLLSIDKVWDEKVDIMLGNHPFHNDIYQKHARYEAGDKKAFEDSTEWHRYLTEMREGYLRFLRTPEEQVAEETRNSQLMRYYGPLAEKS